MNNNRWLRSVLLTVSLFSLALQASAQDHNRRLYDSVANRIRTSYNGHRPHEIYELTSESFRKKMTAGQFAEGMNKFFAKAGSWQSVAYKDANEKGFDYLGKFENSDYLFSLKLDQTGRASRINFAAAPRVIPDKVQAVKSSNRLQDSIDRMVEKVARPYIQKGNTAGLLIAWIGNDGVRRYSYGTTAAGAGKLPDADVTVFEIGSVTKTFTALLLAIEVAAGRMKLEDPVSRYLPDSIPELEYHGTPVTLKHLASHTSGLPRLPQNIFTGNADPLNPYKHYTADSLYRFLRTHRITVGPGTKFSYSNLGAGLLGTILARQSGKTFGRLIEERIARPLGMMRTKVSLTPAELQNMAQGHNETGRGVPPWDLGPLQGSGAIRSTLNDMIVYTQAQLKPGGTLKKAIELSHHAVFTGGEQRMALGWRIDSVSGHSLLHHSGGTGGFRSFVGLDTSRGMGIVILSNAAEEVTELGMELLTRQKAH
ncbi:hypothetical protein C7T94_12320 [Pedobacter yulinensis]|uniref:Beta-lactamase-related domain-containing protein n=1 Tax=Pedobacter yulinensis TaxID=2126353 RepID=A0A2T3HLQ5_9SPHI|nr:serine hydrolase domain-containing protein [Pedobacter yulinensis]PST83356.1 hypothetical protein C7T94_12320 [Pedobacter yulinensis]